MKLAVAVLLSYLPTALPLSPAELEKFVDDVLTLGGWDVANISFRNSVVTQILHIDISETKATKRQFINAIKRSITNQLSYNMMQHYKQQAKEVQNEATQGAS